MYELLTGMRAADAENTVATMAMHISDEPIVLPRNVDVPTCLRAIVDTMLEKSLEHRYQTAEQILRDLEHWDSNKVPTKVASPPLVQRTRTLSQRLPEAQKEVRSQVRLLAILMGSIVSVAILAVLLIKMTDMMALESESSAAEVPVEVSTQPKAIDNSGIVVIEKVVEEKAELDPEPVEPQEIVAAEPKLDPEPAKKRIAKKVKRETAPVPEPVETESKPEPVETPKVVTKEEAPKPIEETKKPVEKTTTKKDVKREPAKKKKKKFDAPITF
jgi:hypothetical protein